MRSERALNDQQTGHAMNVDDAYVVEQRLAQGVTGTTELVTLDGAGPFVRKRMPRAGAHRMVWAALAECTCPYLPRVQATYEMPDEFVAVYDYVPGEVLARVVEQQSCLSLAEVASIMANLCVAVAELHAHGVVHADIAPANVVLAGDGAHLIDFGIARMAFERPSRDEKAWGTRGFAAPEQHGFAAIDTRSDIYALGRLAGHLLTGAHLPEKTYEAELRCSGLVPEAVCRVLGRACAFEPSARYQTVEEFAAAFATAADGKQAVASEQAGPDGHTAAHGEAPREQAAFEGQPAGRGTATQNAVHADASPVQPTERADASPASSAPRQATPRYRRFIMVVLVVLAFLAGAAGIWLMVNHAASSDGSAPAEQQTPDAAAGGALSAEDDAADSVNGLSDDADSATQPSDSSLVDQAADDLKIIESSWYVDASGFVNYAVAIKNTGSNVLALFPTVTVTGRAADGSILFSDDQVLNELYPGETRYWGSIAGGGTEQPATVEFALSRPRDGEVEAAHGKSTRFTVSNVSSSQDQYGDVHVTGEVTLDALGDESSQGMIQLVAICHDAQGALVCGFAGYASLPAEGDAVPFELQSMGGDLPRYETIEVYAYVW